MISRLHKALAGKLKTIVSIQKMNIRTGGSSVTINGQTFKGGSVSISGDKIVIDGVEQQGTLVGPVSVVVQGNAQSVETTSGRVEVTGSAGNVKTMSGNVRCADVTGGVSTMSGDVTCREVGGSVSTMSGDISGLDQ